MTRPEIIRADSIDLQDSNSPSAQDHTRKPSHPAPLGSGPPAPHQAEALRESAVEAAEENHRSPRVSKEWTTGEVQHLHQYGDDLAAGVNSKLGQDNLAIAQNGGHTGSIAEDADMADGEGDDDDDGMDDDMMDKISSSPSIDDGDYSLLQPHLWPQRTDSLSRPPIPPRFEFSPLDCFESSAPDMEEQEQLPLQSLPVQAVQEVTEVPGRKYHRHLLSKYLDESYESGDNYDEDSNYDEEQMDDISPTIGDVIRSYVEPYDRDFELDEYTEYIFQGNLESVIEETDEEKEDEYEERLRELRLDRPSPNSKASIIIQEQDEDENMIISYESSENEEDDDFEFPYSTDSRFVDSGWGGECLQDIEDIDFEFVYALHTFVATVEGQANATKGDTMVLLDDSNSYWWLVRVVKDSSIGYLPAEHIETPTERLARLNKHRNADLTSTMLGDQAEKSKNPLKKALRKRNAKTVTFTAPTYVEASDIDYSSDEEEGEDGFFNQPRQNDQNGDQQDESEDRDETATVEPLKPRSEIKEVKMDSIESDRIESIQGNDVSRNSEEIFDGKPESKSRNGTLRNTDSFFKDDSVETRKITLTPNLLRDDSSTSTRTSNDSKELKRPSLDKPEKDSPEKTKDKKSKKKEEKEKKPGMLRGLFGRKDKKPKQTDEEFEEELKGKRSTESGSSPVPSKDSDEIASLDDPAQVQSQEIQRQPSKLQKQPRTEMSPVRKAGQGREPRTPEPIQAPAPDRAPPVETAQAPSMRLVQPEASQEQIQQPRNISPELTRAPAPLVSAPKEQSKISKILRSGSSSAEPKPVKAKKAKSRAPLDDSDSSADDGPSQEPARAPSTQARPIPGSFPDSYIGTPANDRNNPMERNNPIDRLSESPVQISPVNNLQSYPPALMGDTSSQDEPPSPDLSASPELIEAEDTGDKRGAASSTTSTSTATWSDAHLRTFFDDDADIKDLLVVVYDKSGVVPAGPDHPITGNLFKEENAKLADITNRLDGMLGDWLARKMRAQASR